MKKIFVLCTFLFSVQTFVFSQVIAENTKTRIESKANQQLLSKPVMADYQRTSESPKTLTTPDLNSTYKMAVANDNSLAFNGAWKVEINPKDFMVNVKGGTLSNISENDAQNLTIDVFLIDEKVINLENSEFNGVKISSANIGSMGAKQNYNNFGVKTNLTTIPNSGNYYILLTVSSTDKDGNQVVRSSRTFENQVVF